MIQIQDIISVADPWHFSMDPDSGIHASDKWIRIKYFSYLFKKK